MFATFFLIGFLPVVLSSFSLLLAEAERAWRRPSSMSFLLFMLDLFGAVWYHSLGAMVPFPLFPWLAPIVMGPPARDCAGAFCFLRYF